MIFQSRSAMMYCIISNKYKVVSMYTCVAVSVWACQINLYKWKSRSDV